ncbi:hypothetical protein E2C01_048628 [Portunus trituberculatus]|uniref:Uncharacterized protein n=1 Tax=Portunus trituberculatus TaxID=210409 RepID=A0A5B7GDY0_PORTR|nr:hypothetical protein [Portunus trituberculatus]
MMNKPVLT